MKPTEQQLSELSRLDSLDIVFMPELGQRKLFERLRGVRQRFGYLTSGVATLEPEYKEAARIYRDALQNLLIINPEWRRELAGNPHF